LFELQTPWLELPKVETKEAQEEEQDDTAKGVLERVVRRGKGE
jgi:hypothetical protein